MDYYWHTNTQALLRRSRNELSMLEEKKRELIAELRKINTPDLENLTIQERQRKLQKKIATIHGECIALRAIINRLKVLAKSSLSEHKSFVGLDTRFKQRLDKLIKRSIDNIGDTVDIVKIIKPVYNFKAGGE